MNRQRKSDKPCLPSFAKAKEKQRHPQANASCFTFAFAQPHENHSQFYFTNQKINKFAPMKKELTSLTKIAIKAVFIFTLLINFTSCSSNISSSSSAEEEDKIESSIKGTFNGWAGETLFPLSNGQLWKQCGYAYKYSYAYNPKATISKDNGDYYLQIDGSDDKVKVCKISSFSNETINGTFNGWNGSTVIKLTNGSEWKQFEPHIEIDIAVMPSAIMYDDGGSTKLWIEGTDQPVSVVRN